MFNGIFWKCGVLIQVLVVLCFIVCSCRGLAANDTAAACELQDLGEFNYGVSCSNRNIANITGWPEEALDGIDKDSINQIRISYYNNSITKIPVLPPLAGKKISLGLQVNQIGEIEPGAFSNVGRIFSLDLGSNRLQAHVLRANIFRGSYKNDSYGSIALQILNLDNNDIHSIDRYLFKYTPNLTSLYLNNNPLKVIDHVTMLALSDATNLQILDLSYTEISSIPLETFELMSYLRYIDLSGNKFLTVPESLQHVGNSLEILTFNNNSIEELNEDSFVGLKKLEQLEVGDNPYLKEVKRYAFSPLVSLKILHLCHNPNLRYISHIAFLGLKEKWTISEVYLDDNSLSELSTDLMPWDKLETIGMTKNKWLCNCDLENIVTTQGAGKKFKPDEIPVCAAPMKWTGAYTTNISLPYCSTNNSPNSLSNLKPKHVLWSILGVASVACLGMLIGLFLNALKALYVKKFRSEPVSYINLNEDSSFA